MPSRLHGPAQRRLRTTAARVHGLRARGNVVEVVHLKLHTWTVNDCVGVLLFKLASHDFFFANWMTTVGAFWVHMVIVWDPAPTPTSGILAEQADNKHHIRMWVLQLVGAAFYFSCLHFALSESIKMTRLSLLFMSLQPVVCRRNVLSLSA